jgi:hypothetical protein
MFCPQCGDEVGVGARFCEGCGARLSTAVERSEQQASPVPAATPAPASGRPELQITGDAARLAIRDGATMVAGLFAACFVLVAFALLVGARGSSFRDWLDVGGWLAGMTFRGHLTSSGSTSLGPLGELGGGLRFAFQPGLPFVCAIAFVAWRSWRLEAERQSATVTTLAVYAAITAASAAIAEAVLAALLTGRASFASGNEQFQSGASLGVGVPSVLVGTFVYVWLSCAAARLVSAWSREGVPARWRVLAAPWLGPARELAEFVAFGAVPVALLGAAALVVGGASAGVWMLGLLTLPFAVIAGLIFSAGVGVAVGASIGVGSVGSSYGMLSGGVSAWTYALLLFPCFAVLMVAARSSSRGVPADPPWPNAGRGAAIACACFVIVAFATSITGGGDAIGTAGSFRIGLDWGTGIAVALFWGGAVPLAGFFLPRWIGRRRLVAIDGALSRLVSRSRPSAAAPVAAGAVSSPAVSAEASPLGTPATRPQPAAPSPETPVAGTASGAATASPVEEPPTEPQQAQTLPGPCPRCGHENPAGSRFCGRCGDELAATGSAPAGVASPRPSILRWRGAGGVLVLLIVVAAAGASLATGVFSHAHAGTSARTGRTRRVPTPTPTPSPTLTPAVTPAPAAAAVPDVPRSQTRQAIQDLLREVHEDIVAGDIRAEWNLLTARKRASYLARYGYAEWAAAQRSLSKYLDPSGIRVRLVSLDRDTGVATVLVTGMTWSKPGARCSQWRGITWARYEEGDWRYDPGYDTTRQRRRQWKSRFSQLLGGSC